MPKDDAAFSSGLAEWREKLLPEVERLASACPLTFDETALFAGDDADETRRQLAERFERLQTVMSCVGCDRCKLWGTLQTLGIGTALRVLFQPPRSDSTDNAQDVVLSRQEAVALTYTLERFSSSLEYMGEMRAALLKQAEQTLL